MRIQTQLRQIKRKITLWRVKDIEDCSKKETMKIVQIYFENLKNF